MPLHLTFFLSFLLFFFLSFVFVCRGPLIWAKTKKNKKKQKQKKAAGVERETQVLRNKAHQAQKLGAKKNQIFNILLLRNNILALRNKAHQAQKLKQELELLKLKLTQAKVRAN